MKSIVYYIRKAKNNPDTILIYLINTGVLNWLDDKTFLSLKYRARLGKKLNLDMPQEFNEKLQWLKLYDRNLQYSLLVDKYSSKAYVAKTIGEKYLIPTLGVWDEFDQIDFSNLPNQFVLKCTHDSGGVVLVRDKKKLNMKAAREKINKSLKRNYYKVGREWPYKNVPHRIIAEAYMGDNLQDYKIFCFNGKPKMTLVCSNRFEKTGLCEDFFDNNWKHLNLKRPNHDNYYGDIKKPQGFDIMLKLAEELSRNLPFARIDFYDINGKLYFGEITLYPANGFEGFDPPEWDRIIGDWLVLPESF